VTERLHRRTTCRLCDARTLTRVLSLVPTPPANAFVAAPGGGEPQGRFPLDVFLCRACGHVQLLDIVDPLRLFQHRRSAIQGLPLSIAYFEAYAGDLMQRFRLAQDALVVEIGSNDGTMLRCLENAGMRPQGVEPAVDLARDAIARGVPTFPGFFSPAIAARIEEERGRAAMVIAHSVFAHTDDLSGLLEGVQQLLARDGIFVFEIPYLLDMVERSAVDTIRHENLSYHAIMPLLRFLHANDMELIGALRVGGAAGRLRGYAQRLGGRHAADGSVQHLCEEEQRAAVAEPATFHRLEERIAGLRDALSGMLRAVRDAGGRVAGYGAPAKATTLLHQFGLGPEIIDFIVDDSPWKQGLLMPGLDIPVLPPEALYERRPDVVIVLAWDYAEDIVARHRAYQSAGGRFIVPLPEIAEIEAMGPQDRQPEA
jgi:SAM-dependent methyltransferase